MLRCEIFLQRSIEPWSVSTSTHVNVGFGSLADIGGPI
jgi:hypothetical protein